MANEYYEGVSEELRKQLEALSGLLGHVPQDETDAPSKLLLTRGWGYRPKSDDERIHEILSRYYPPSSEETPDRGSIGELGRMLGGLGSMSPAALEGIAAFSGLDKVVRHGALDASLDGASRAAQTPEEGENWAPRLTRETRTIPNPDYDPDEVIHEILSRYYRGGER